MALLLVLLVSACGRGINGAGTRGSNTNPVENVIADQIAAAEADQNAPEQSGVETETDAGAFEENGSEAGKAEGSTSDSTPEVVEEKFDTEEKSDTELPGTGETYDYDLTLMNKDMVYSTIYQFMYYPEEYEGKTVRMRGQFVPYEDEETGKVYYCCFVSDAAACCQQGMEFVCKDDRLADPQDWPEDFAEIEISGVYETYMEDELRYCHLNNATMVEVH